MIFDQSFIDPEPCISVKFNLILVTNTKKRRKRDIEIKRKKKKTLSFKQQFKLYY